MSQQGSSQKFMALIGSNQNFSTMQTNDLQGPEIINNHNLIKQTPESSYSMLLNSRMEGKKDDPRHVVLGRNKVNDLQPHFHHQSLSNKRSVERGFSESSFVDESIVGSAAGVNQQMGAFNLERGSIEITQDQSQFLHNSMMNSRQLQQYQQQWQQQQQQQQGFPYKLNDSRNYSGKLACEESIISRTHNSKDTSKPLIFSTHFQKTSVAEDDQRPLERLQGYEFKYQFAGNKSTYVPMSHRDPKLIWKKGFFQIIRYVNKFLFTLKKTMIFRRPHLLQEHQIQAIDDKGAKQFSEGFGQKSKKLAKIVRSNFKLFRKIRIMSLMMKKSLKFVINPYTKFKNKCIKCIMQISKQIPIIMPYSKISNLTDFLHGLLILFFLVAIPFELAFEFQSTEYLQTQVYDMMRLFLFIQIVINFYTAFYDKGCIVVQKRKIFKRYVFKFFIFDLLALLCLYETFMVFTNFQKLFFFVKIKSLKEIVSKFREQFHMHEKTQVLIQIVILFFQTFLLCHFFACTFYFIARWEKANGYDNWIQHYEEQEGNVIKNGIFSKYVVSLYFSVILIGTIGFGDYCPQTEIEMIYILILGFIASGFFGYVLSQIGGIIREIAKKEEKFKARLKELNRQFY